MNYDVIYNSSTDPYFNLAAEQYLLDRKDSRPVFMLWRNAQTVVIGRYQNAYAEINEPFVRENGIKVVRRLTGGGAVFHDLGNVNYSFISPKEGAAALDFARFSAPVIDALACLGVNALLSGRNDIEIDSLKVSGNAQCVRGDRILHHGTLLWSADLSALDRALRVDPEKIASKGIKSVRSRVANIREIAGSEMDAVQFIDFLFARVGGTPRGFDDDEIAEISKLRDERYGRWEWNWGESKNFSASRKRRFPYGTVEVCFDSSRGVIGEISVCGDFFGICDISELERSLCGVRLERGELSTALSEVACFISGAEPAEIADLILGRE